jgi:hypothetical protein
VLPAAVFVPVAGVVFAKWHGSEGAWHIPGSNGLGSGGRREHGNAKDPYIFSVLGKGTGGFSVPVQTVQARWSHRRSQVTPQQRAEAFHTPYRECPVTRLASSVTAYSIDGR